MRNCTSPAAGQTSAAASRADSVGRRTSTSFQDRQGPSGRRLYANSPPRVSTGGLGIRRRSRIQVVVWSRGTSATHAYVYAYKIWTSPRTLHAMNLLSTWCLQHVCIFCTKVS